MAHREGAQELRLAQDRLVTDDVGQGLLGGQVEMGRDRTELQVQVHEDNAVGPSLCRRHRDVRRDGRRPDPTLGAEDGDHSAGLRDREAVGRDDRRLVLRSLEAQEERLDPRLDLSCVERSGDDVVRSGLQEADPLLDVVAVGHAQDGHRGHGRRGPDLAA